MKMSSRWNVSCRVGVMRKSRRGHGFLSWVAQERRAPVESSPDGRPSDRALRAGLAGGPSGREGGGTKVAGHRRFAPDAVRGQPKFSAQQSGHPAVTAVCHHGGQVCDGQAIAASDLRDALSHDLDSAAGQLDSAHADLGNTTWRALDAKDSTGAAVRTQTNVEEGHWPLPIRIGGQNNSGGCIPEQCGPFATGPRLELEMTSRRLDRDNHHRTDSC